jgi:hypothetical protein
MIDYSDIFKAYDSLSEIKKVTKPPSHPMEAFLSKIENKKGNAFARMQLCREALEGLDRQGWQRSFHQRLFHDNFIRACARIFWKTEPPGSFAKDHQKILEINGWDHLSQEILVSTPRRSSFCFYCLFWFQYNFTFAAIICLCSWNHLFALTATCSTLFTKINLVEG